MTGSVSWLASDRSDENQRLSAKVLIEWSETLLKDLKRLAPIGQTSTPRELLRMRAVHHNILVDERSWDVQIELIRSTTDSPFLLLHPRHNARGCLQGHSEHCGRTQDSLLNR